MRSRFFLAGCGLCLWFLVSGGPVPAQAAQAGGEFVIAGLVTDASGMPVPRLPVRVSVSTRPLQADPRLGLKSRTLIVSGVTASDGTYRVVVPLRGGKLKYYLSFYEQGLFDDVRFARPSRIDITKKVKAGDFLLLDHRLEFHGSWAKVQETLKAYSKKSARAGVIRRYGIAEEIRKSREGKKIETWWYYTKGKRFDFEGDKIVAEKNFSPVFK